MAPDWLTYEQLAERLGTTPEGARQRAIRGRWQRTKGNDGKARVRLPDGWADDVRTPIEQPNRKPVRHPDERATTERLIAALESHVSTLKDELKAERERTDQLTGTLAAEKARAETAIADYVRRLDDAQRRGDDLAAELLAEKSRSWWNRLIG